MNIKNSRQLKCSILNFCVGACITLIAAFIPTLPDHEKYTDGNHELQH